MASSPQMRACKESNDERPILPTAAALSTTEERAANRAIVEKQISCLIRGSWSKAQMYDLSTDGCMMGEFRELLMRGEGVTVEFDEDLSTRAEVVWLRGGCAGLRFHEKLHPVIVQLLGFKQPAPSFDQKPPFDRFGRPMPELDSECRPPDPDTF